MEVEVKYISQEARLPLLVVTGEGPSLLGRDWFQQIQLDWREIHSLQQDPLDAILHQHEKVFQEGLGTMQGYKACFLVDDKVKPKLCKAQPVPYAMRALVKQELDRLTKEGIIEPVQFAEWAAPIVPVLKSDKKSVRVCGDFKLTINQASKLDSYPIPKVEDLFAAGGKMFTKLDVSQAYQHIGLEESSKNYVVINTQKGLFRYTRLPYGFSPRYFSENYGKSVTGDEPCCGVHR